MAHARSKRYGYLSKTLTLLIFSAGAGANDFSIVNGVEANATTYPWYVTVNSGTGQCGGSVIHPQWILSAAHCFKPDQAPDTVKIVAGRQRLSDTTGQVITGKRIQIHPQYNTTTIDNDIALVELTTPISDAVTAKVAPPAQPVAAGLSAKSVGRGALAAPLNYLIERLSLGGDCSGSNLDACIGEATRKGTSDTTIITTLLLANGLGDATKGIGYSELVKLAQIADPSIGTTPSVDAVVTLLKSKTITVTELAYEVVKAASGSDELREVDLPLVAVDACQTSLSMSLTSNMFCAGYKDTPRDTCQGDSGGPLVVRNPNNSDWIQLGIVSFGNACATNYGVYTKLSNYLDWIGQYVPNFDAERVYMWGENVAAPQLLKASGSEHSTTAYAPYWARIYPGSGTALGVNQSDNTLWYYDGAALIPLGALSGWLAQARSAGY